jgi:ArsR family transcriptional regulator
VNIYIEKFKALGEETRLRAVRILAEADQELCVCEIVDVLKKPLYTVSKALSHLKMAGFVEERREGRLMTYRLIKNSFNAVLLASVESLPPHDPLYQDDFANLEARLGLREGGRCVVTYQPNG